MKKFILFCILSLVLSGCVIQNKDLINDSKKESINKNIHNRDDFSEERKKYCESLGAQYGLIAGCGDDCSYQRNPKEYGCFTDSGHLGCYCEGDDRCWNGSGCEDL